MKQVLLIEDDPFMVDIYLTRFKEEGFEAVRANDGEEALKRMREHKPDLILLDLILPRLNGWEFLAKLRQRPSLQDVKVMILSNIDQKSALERASRLGVAKYLVKANHTPSEVVTEVKRMLK